MIKNYNKNAACLLDVYKNDINGSDKEDHPGQVPMTEREADEEVEDNGCQPEQCAPIALLLSKRHAVVIFHEHIE